MSTLTPPTMTDPEKAPRPKSPGAPNRMLAQWAWTASDKLWVLFDMAGAILSVVLAYSLTPHVVDPTLRDHTATAMVTHTCGLVLSIYLAGLYERSIFAIFGQMLLRVLLASAAATLLTVAFFYFGYFQAIGRWVILYLFVFSALAAFLPRLLFWWILRRRRRRVLFLGETPLVHKMIDALSGSFGSLYKVSDIIQLETLHEQPSDPRFRDELFHYCRERGVDEIILPAESALMEHSLGPALKCVPLGCKVRTVADLYEELFRRVPASEMSLAWLFGFGWDATNHIKASIKRISDIVLALFVLALSSPLWLLIPALIKLSSRGPVFYTQIRVGQYGKLFKIIKFRSMQVNAENGRVQWAKEDDPRVTRIGRWLRRSRLDELPQLINILVGQMSFVGPRPERPEFTKKLEEEVHHYAFRHLVRPGLTGWAQVNYRYGSDIEDVRIKLEYDLYYIRHFSIPLDMGIVLKTAVSLMRGSR